MWYMSEPPGFPLLCQILRSGAMKRLNYTWKYVFDLCNENDIINDVVIFGFEWYNIQNWVMQPKSAIDKNSRYQILGL